MDELTARVVRNARRRGCVVLSPQQWGSQQVDLYHRRLETHPVSVVRADTLWQHVTVTPDTGPLIGDFRRDMQAVERIGVERFGTGFSYNWGIDPTSGMIGVGQFLKARGSHTINDKGVPGFSLNQNYVARAMAWIAMPGFRITRKARRSAAILFAAMIEEGALTRSPDYVPHSLVAAKDCPTQAARDQMTWIRQTAISMVAQPAVDEAARLRPDVVALRGELTEFLSVPRRAFVRTALLTADEALARIERR